MKRLTSVLISLLIVLSLAAPFSAYADSGLYDSETPEIKHSSSYVLNGKTYYSMGNELYDYLQKKLEQRETEFPVYYISDGTVTSSSKRNDILFDAYLGATFDGFSKTSTDGDYLLWSVDDFSAKSAVLNATGDGCYYYTITAVFSYYDTLKEEEQTDSAVNAFLDIIDINGKTDYQIIKGLHDYICDKNKYNTAAAKHPNKHLYAFSPYGALIKESAVCHGYALTFYRLCRELGYKVRFVYSNPDIGAHAWNIVRLDNKYYVLDSTWDDFVLDGTEDRFPSSFFLLTDYDSSRTYDNQNEHELYNLFFDNDYFYYNYRQHFATVPYADEGGNRLSACKVTLNKMKFTYTKNAVKPTVKITLGNKTLEEGKDYSLSYSQNVNTGVGRVDISGLGDFAGTSTARVFLITPKKPSKPSAKSVKTKSVKLAWKKVGGASGYDIQYNDGKKWIFAGTTAKTAFTVKNLKPSTKYKFRIRAYKTVNKRKVNSSYGKYVLRYTKSAKVKITSLEPAKASLKVKWGKRKGYQITYSYNKNFKSAKSVKVKYGRVSKTLKNLKSGKTCYVKIRAYRKYKTENGKTKTVYGAWSVKKYARIK